MPFDPDDRTPSDRHDRMLVRLAGASLAVFGTALVAEALLRPRLVSPDSFTYVDVARNLAGGFGLKSSVSDLTAAAAGSWSPDRVPFTMDPPLFPACIAAGIAAGMEPVRAALLVPLAGMAATVALAFVLARRLWDSATAWVTLAVLVLPVAAGSVSAHAWSEPLGFALALLSVLCVARAPGEIGRDRGILPYALAGLAAGAAFATRYPLGLALPVGLIAAWCSGKGRLRRASVLLVGAAIVIVPIVLRNRALAGAWLGSHHPIATDGAGAALAQAWVRLSQTPVRRVACALALGLGAALLAANVRRAAWRGTAQRIFGDGRLLVAAWVVLFPLEMVAARSIAAFDDLGLRLLGPALVFGVLLFAAILTGARRVPVATTAALVTLVALAGAGLAVARVARYPDASPAHRIAWSSRLSWIRDHVGPTDLVAGDNTRDVPLCFRDRDGGPRRVASFSPAPYSAPVTDADLEGFARAAGERGSNAWLLLQVSPQAHEEDWRASFGAVIADLAIGRMDRHSEVERVAVLPGCLVFRVRTPGGAAVDRR